MQEILTPIRERRKYYEEHKEEVYKLLEEDTKKAIEVTYPEFSEEEEKAFGELMDSDEISAYVEEHSDISVIAFCAALEQRARSWVNRNFCLNCIAVFREQSRCADSVIKILFDNRRQVLFCIRLHIIA